MGGVTPSNACGICKDITRPKNELSDISHYNNIKGFNNFVNQEAEWDQSQTDSGEIEYDDESNTNQHASQQQLYIGYSQKLQQQADISNYMTPILRQPGSSTCEKCKRNSSSTTTPTSLCATCTQIKTPYFHNNKADSEVTNDPPNTFKLILNSQQKNALFSQKERQPFPPPALLLTTNPSLSVEYIPVQQLCTSMFDDDTTNNNGHTQVIADENWKGTYLTSGLQALVYKPTLLSRLFSASSVLSNTNATDKNDLTLYEFQSGSEKEYFDVFLLFCGSVTCLRISNQVPVESTHSQPRHPLYMRAVTTAKGNKSLAFAPLLLKAIATVFDSYKTIEKGSFGQLIRDLTCAPFEYIRIEDPLVVIMYIQACFERGYLVSLSRELENSYAHIVTSVNGESVTVERGEAQQKIMSIEEIMQSYIFCGVNKCNEDYFYTSLDHTISTRFSEKKKDVFLMKLSCQNPHQPNHAFITVTQQDKRSASVVVGSPKQPTYNLIKMIVVRGFVRSAPTYEVVSEKVIAWQSHVGRDLTLECTLDSQYNHATYLAFIEIHYDAAVICAQKVNVNCYSQYPIYLYPCKLPKHRKTTLFDSIVSPFMLHQQLSTHRYPEDGYVTRMKAIAAGFVIVMYQNLSEDESVLREMIVVRKRTSDKVIAQAEISVPAATPMKVWSYSLPKGIDESDIIINIIYTDFTLSLAKMKQNAATSLLYSPTNREQRLFKGIAVQVYFSVYAFSEKLEYTVYNLNGDIFKERDINTSSSSNKQSKNEQVLVD